MTTIFNNPSSGGDGDNSLFGFIIGAIIVIILVVLFLIYGLPAVWPSQTTPDPTIIPVSNTTNTTNTNSSTTINIIPAATGTKTN